MSLNLTNNFPARTTPGLFTGALVMLTTMDGADKVTLASEITMAMAPYMSDVMLVGMVVDLIVLELVVDSDFDIAKVKKLNKIKINIMIK